MRDKKLDTLIDRVGQAASFVTGARACGAHIPQHDIDLANAKAALREYVGELVEQARRDAMQPIEADMRRIANEEAKKAAAEIERKVASERALDAFHDAQQRRNR